MNGINEQEKVWRQTVSCLMLSTAQCQMALKGADDPGYASRKLLVRTASEDD
jgi:hypothetical protein